MDSAVILFTEIICNTNKLLEMKKITYVSTVGYESISILCPISRIYAEYCQTNKQSVHKSLIRFLSLSNKLPRKK